MEPGPLMLIALIGAHCYFDYAGQGDFMARAKNHEAPIPGVPWSPVLSAHAWIHGAAVGLITGIWWLFTLEFAAHLAIDHAKCGKRISFMTDQRLHILCKLVWFVCALAVA